MIGGRANWRWNIKEENTKKKVYLPIDDPYRYLQDYEKLNGENISFQDLISRSPSIDKRNIHDPIKQNPSVKNYIKPRKIAHIPYAYCDVVYLQDGDKF